jgi:hypothetical protein
MSNIQYNPVADRITLEEEDEQEMFNSKMRLIGVAALVCFAAIIAVPAFAVQPVQGHNFNNGNNGASETKLLGFAENLTENLKGKGVDVTNLNAALATAQNAVQSSNSTAFRDAMKTFNQDIQAGIKSGSISKSDLPQLVQGSMRGNRTYSSSKIRYKGANSTASPQVL